jgi:hypothetical protein
MSSIEIIQNPIGSIKRAYDLITNTIDDIRTNIVKKSKQGDLIKLVYQPSDIFVEGDKVRIAKVITILTLKSLMMMVRLLLGLRTQISV